MKPGNAGGAKGPQFKDNATSSSGTGGLAMSLPTLESVQKLQTALHAKAKGEPKFRFYALYDKVYRADVLWMAWRHCRVNGGKPGVDGQTFEDIEQYGVTKWLENWRKNSGRRRTSPKRCVGCTFPSRTESSVRWASPRSRIAWCKRR